MNKTLYIIRGLPGSGKSTLGRRLADTDINYHPTRGGVVYHSYAADDWFTDKDGNYNFDPQELPQAHEDCRARVMGAMMSGTAENICVCNTFTQFWEAEPYVKLCKQYGYTPVVLECQSQFGNIHDVPQESINAMADRWDSREDFMYQLNEQQLQYE